MNSLQLLEAIGGVDDTLLQKAHQPLPVKRHIVLRMAATAACVCLIAGAAAWCSGYLDDLLDMNQASNGYFTSSREDSATADSQAPDHGRVESSAADSSSTDTSITSGKSVKLSITGWNADGFSAVVCNTDAVFDYGTEVQVVMNEETVCYYKAVNTEPYDMNVSNTAYGSEVEVLFTKEAINDNGNFIFAKTVNLFIQVHPE